MLCLLESGCLVTVFHTRLCMKARTHTLVIDMQCLSPPTNINQCRWHRTRTHTYTHTHTYMCNVNLQSRGMIMPTRKEPKMACTCVFVYHVCVYHCGYGIGSQRQCVSTCLYIAYKEQGGE